jgi:hypothetical protein
MEEKGERKKGRENNNVRGKNKLREREKERERKSSLILEETIYFECLICFFSSSFFLFSVTFYSFRLPFKFLSLLLNDF